jgi:hypothetical protein
MRLAATPTSSADWRAITINTANAAARNDQKEQLSAPPFPIALPYRREKSFRSIESSRNDFGKRCVACSWVDFWLQGVHVIFAVAILVLVVLLPDDISNDSL